METTIENVKDTSQDYHSKLCLSASYMNLLKQCPAKCYYAMTHPSKPTADMEFGTYFHALVLEPEREDKDFHILQYKGTTKDGKAEKKEAEEKGQIILTQEDQNLAYAMRDSLKQNEVWRMLSGEGLLTEQSFYWEEMSYGRKVPCKARLDGYIRFAEETYIIDLKTTKDSGPDAIQKTIATYSSHLQAAWYMHALELEELPNPKFVFFYIEKQPPYICTPVMLSDAAIATAREEIWGLIDKFADCLEHGWEEVYVPPSDVLTVDLPHWYK